MSLQNAEMSEGAAELDEKVREEGPTGQASRETADRHALEIVFLLVVGALVLAAFIQAFSYQLVSSRTPFVIMVPLILLLCWQLARLLGQSGMPSVAVRIRSALSDTRPAPRKTFVLICWLVALLLTILTAGHYIAIAGFIFALCWYLSGEKWRLSLTVALVTTAIIYLIFEVGFNIELYPGMIYRYYAGYRSF